MSTVMPSFCLCYTAASTVTSVFVDNRKTALLSIQPLATKFLSCHIAVCPFGFLHFCSGPLASISDSYGLCHMRTVLSQETS